MTLPNKLSSGICAAPAHVNTAVGVPKCVAVIRDSVTVVLLVHSTVCITGGGRAVH